MSLLPLFSLGFTAQALAVTSVPALYDTQLVFMVAGKERLVHLRGEEGKLMTFESQDEDGVRRLELTSTEEGRGRVLMQLRISFESKDGRTRISGRPKIVALEGEAAKVEMAAKKDAPSEFSVSVTSRRIEGDLE